MIRKIKDNIYNNVKCIGIPACQSPQQRVGGTTNIIQLFETTLTNPTKPYRFQLIIKYTSLLKLYLIIRRN